MAPTTGDLLLFRVGPRTCAVPLAHVREIMRPLAVAEIADAPGFVLGVSRIRGVPTPVVDMASILGAAGSRPERFVTLTCGARTAALAVGPVLGVRRSSDLAFGDVPPLLGDAARDVVNALSALDAELLFVLETARLVPDSLWDAIGDAR